MLIFLSVTIGARVQDLKTGGMVGDRRKEVIGDRSEEKLEVKRSKNRREVRREEK